MIVRRIQPEDVPQVRSFLKERLAVSLFLLNNLEQGGLEDRGERLQGRYWLAIDDQGEIQGVLAHYWNNMVLPVIEAGLPQLANALVKERNRPIQGIIGHMGNVRGLQAALQLKDEQFRLQSEEVLYQLNLADMELKTGEGNARLATESDITQLVQWRIAYSQEALNEPASEQQAQQSHDNIVAMVKDETLWVLEVDNQPVAMTGFNSKVAGAVQVGGVYTPPEFRSRGYGRHLVSASLAAEYEQGSQISILFTDQGNTPARKAYESIGYRLIGEFGIFVMAEELPL